MWALHSPPHLDRAEYWAISTYPVTQTIGKVLGLITISCAIVRKTDCEVMSGNTLYKTQTRNDQAEKTLKTFYFDSHIINDGREVSWFLGELNMVCGMATNNKML